MILWEILQDESESLSVFLFIPPPPSLQAPQPRRTKRAK